MSTYTYHSGKQTKTETKYQKVPFNANLNAVWLMKLHILRKGRVVFKLAVYFCKAALRLVRNSRMGNASTSEVFLSHLKPSPELSR